MTLCLGVLLLKITRKVRGATPVSVLETVTLSPDTVPHLREAVSTLSSGGCGCTAALQLPGVSLYKCHLKDGIPKDHTKAGQK